MSTADVISGLTSIFYILKNEPGRLEAILEVEKRRVRFYDIKRNTVPYVSDTAKTIEQFLNVLRGLNEADVSFTVVKNEIAINFNVYDINDGKNVEKRLIFNPDFFDRFSLYLNDLKNEVSVANDIQEKLKNDYLTNIALTAEEREYAEYQRLKAKYEKKESKSEESETSEGVE